MSLRVQVLTTAFLAVATGFLAVHQFHTAPLTAQLASSYSVSYLPFGNTLGPQMNNQSFMMQHCMQYPFDPMCRNSNSVCDPRSPFFNPNHPSCASLTKGSLSNSNLALHSLFYDGNQITVTYKNTSNYCLGLFKSNNRSIGLQNNELCDGGRFTGNQITETIQVTSSQRTLVRNLVGDNLKLCDVDYPGPLVCASLSKVLEGCGDGTCHAQENHTLCPQDCAAPPPPPPPPSAAETIIDNSDPEFSMTGWNGSYPRGYKNNMYAGSPTKEISGNQLTDPSVFTWTATLPDGEYEVYAHWPGDRTYVKARSKAVPFTVTGLRKTLTTRVDQTVNPSELIGNRVWQRLSAYTFRPNAGTITVQLNALTAGWSNGAYLDGSKKFVLADAILFKRVGDGDDNIFEEETDEDEEDMLQFVDVILESADVLNVTQTEESSTVEVQYRFSNAGPGEPYALVLSGESGIPLNEEQHDGDCDSTGTSFTCLLDSTATEYTLFFTTDNRNTCGDLSIEATIAGDESQELWDQDNHQSAVANVPCPAPQLQVKQLPFSADSVVGPDATNIAVLRLELTAKNAGISIQEMNFEVTQGGFGAQQDGSALRLQLDTNNDGQLDTAPMLGRKWPSSTTMLQFGTGQGNMMVLPEDTTVVVEIQAQDVTVFNNQPFQLSINAQQIVRALVTNTNQPLAGVSVNGACADTCSIFVETDTSPVISQQPSADLAVSFEGTDVEYLKIGDTGSVSFKITNNGTHTTTADLRVSLPGVAGGISSLPNGCRIFASAITCDIPVFNPGDERVYDFGLNDLNMHDPITVSIEGDIEDPNESNNQLTVSPESFYSIRSSQAAGTAKQPLHTKLASVLSSFMEPPQSSALTAQLSVGNGGFFPPLTGYERWWNENCSGPRSFLPMCALPEVNNRNTNFGEAYFDGTQLHITSLNTSGQCFRLHDTSHQAINIGAHAICTQRGRNNNISRTQAITVPAALRPGLAAKMHHPVQLCVPHLPRFCTNRVNLGGCGDNICQLNENANTCSQDCAVTFENPNQPDMVITDDSDTSTFSHDPNTWKMDDLNMPGSHRDTLHLGTRYTRWDSRARKRLQPSIFTWEQPLADGIYEVYANWTNDRNASPMVSKAVPYTIMANNDTDTGVKETIYVDQTKAPTVSMADTKWVRLGENTYRPAQTGSDGERTMTVTINAKNAGVINGRLIDFKRFVIADGLLFKKVGDAPEPEPEPEIVYADLSLSEPTVIANQGVFNGETIGLEYRVLNAGPDDPIGTEITGTVPVGMLFDASLSGNCTVNTDRQFTCPVTGNEKTLYFTITNNFTCGTSATFITSVDATGSSDPMRSNNQNDYVLPVPCRKATLSVRHADAGAGGVLTVDQTNIPLASFNVTASNNTVFVKEFLFEVVQGALPANENGSSFELLVNGDESTVYQAIKINDRLLKFVSPDQGGLTRLFMLNASESATVTVRARNAAALGVSAFQLNVLNASTAVQAVESNQHVLFGLSYNGTCPSSCAISVETGTTPVWALPGESRLSLYFGGSSPDYAPASRDRDNRITLNYTIKNTGLSPSSTLFTIESDSDDITFDLANSACSATETGYSCDFGWLQPNAEANLIFPVRYEYDINDRLRSKNITATVQNEDEENVATDNQVILRVVPAYKWR